MKRFGLLVLTIWFGFNCILALSIVIGISFFDINAPALSVYFENSFIDAANHHLIAMVNTMAILLNAVITAYCGLVLIILWKKSFLKERSLFWPVITSASFIQIFGFVSDSFMEHRNVWANIVSTLVLVVGIAGCMKARLK